MQNVVVSGNSPLRLVGLEMHMKILHPSEADTAPRHLQSSHILQQASLRVQISSSKAIGHAADLQYQLTHNNSSTKMAAARHTSWTISAAGLCIQAGMYGSVP